MNELSLFNNFFDGMTDDGYMFPSFNLKKAFQTPKVDVKKSEKEYTLQMDLPGRTEKDVDIELNNNVLTISSSKETKTEDKSDKHDKDNKECKNSEKWLIRERTYSEFTRSFTLPEDVDGEKLSANVSNGILTVVMPRKAIPSPKKIAITSL